MASLRRRVSLQVRLVLVLLIVSLVPLAVSALLIRQIAEVAQNFASNQAAQLRPPLKQAESSFGALIAAKKELFREVATRVSVATAVGLAASETDPSAELDRKTLAQTLLARELSTSPDLLGLELRSADGSKLALVERASPTRTGVSRFRQVEETRELPEGRTLTARFAADLAIADDLASVADALRVSGKADRVRQSLPAGYVVAFFALVGGVVALVTLIGIVVARRLSRRVQTLLGATRELARGDLESHVDIPGRDELAELGTAFNSMVDDLRSDREQILYLQRIGAWQDVARRLAHEIKNPLTPIGLAMQQVVSSYKGDDERFAKLLADADEIVGEEITSLKRLVDAFSALGRLPRVDAKPLDLAVVLDDLSKDPVFTDNLVIDPPPQPVTVGGDRLLLRRLIANLVENGIQAGIDAGDGKVVVTWRADRSLDAAVLTIDDGGGGIDPCDAERLFEPYVTSKDTGTGLGLAIAKKIALEHKGDLSIDSEPSPLGGARIRLEIPLA